jgi:hypothetical protein
VGAGVIVVGGGGGGDAAEDDGLMTTVATGCVPSGYVSGSRG